MKRIQLPNNYGITPTKKFRVKRLAEYQDEQSRWKRDSRGVFGAMLDGLALAIEQEHEARVELERVVLVMQKYMRVPAEQTDQANREFGGEDMIYSLMVLWVVIVALPLLWL